MKLPFTQKATLESRFDTSVRSQLDGLMFTARRLVEGMYAGRHVSPKSGMGLDFHDYRAYVPGEPLGDLDWKLLGRTDRYYIRRYRQQTDLQVYIMLDASASMGFRGVHAQGSQLSAEAHPSKYEAGCLLAAAIAFLTLRQNDRPGLGMFTKRLIHHLPPSGTPSHFQHLCATLEKHALPPGPGDIQGSLKQLHGVLRRRGLIVLISDLLDEPSTFFDAIAPLKHAGHEVIVLQLLSEQELNLSKLTSPAGRQAFNLVDIETRTTVPTRIKTIEKKYNQLMEDHIVKIRQGCISKGIEHQLVCSTDSPIKALRQYLTRRAALRR